MLAHILGKRKQTLENHSRNVAELAALFASQLGCPRWGWIAGILHDAGKADPRWQNYLLKQLNVPPVNHSRAGAQGCMKLNKFQDYQKLLLSYIISGHHAGLPDWSGQSGDGLEFILGSSEWDEIKGRIPYLKGIETLQLEKCPPEKDNLQNCMEHFHLFIRMLYSCLVDADFLDTEQFMNASRSKYRGEYNSLRELKTRFDCYMDKISGDAAKTDLNSIRAEVLESCRKKAELEPGVYILNVPTGGGKTLSSMAFALEHAVRYGKKRIITAIPYTSIIEQTSNVYRYGTDDEQKIATGKYELFGAENVLEHHCAVNHQDESSESMLRHELAAENWDAPVIVTTNVQLFESLFNAHSSACRKLHNIADSVIILDEVQMLPPRFLDSIISVLKGLVLHYGVTVVLSTATQPALVGKIGSGDAVINGFDENSVCHIIENPARLAKQLERVVFNTSLLENKNLTWEEIASYLNNYQQVLCIVQTRKQCRNLHSLMPEGTYHLSALMCPQERSEVISEIKRKLKAGECVRVISTQLVECGVDIDFPVVFKALAGADSIAQAAGRCNREGKCAEAGQVFVFKPERCISQGLLRIGSDATSLLLKKYNNKFSLDPCFYQEYFRNYFGYVDTLDKPGYRSLMHSESGKFEFRTLSNNYHLIDNSNQGTLIVRYQSVYTGESNDSILQDFMDSCEYSFEGFRNLTRYLVNLPVKELQVLCEQNRIKKIYADKEIYVQMPDDDTLYQNGYGVVSEADSHTKSYIF